MRLSRYERVATWLCAARTRLDLLNVPRGPDGARGVRAYGVRDRVLFRVLRRGTWGQPPAAAPAMNATKPGEYWCPDCNGRGGVGRVKTGANFAFGGPEYVTARTCHRCLGGGSVRVGDDGREGPAGVRRVR